MEDNNLERVHEKLLKTHFVNSNGVSAFIVFFQVNKPVQYGAF